MRIVVVSRSWPPNERSGLSLVAELHVNILLKSGHEVSIIGSHPSILSLASQDLDRKYIAATGSGALYSPAWVDCSSLEKYLGQLRPDLLIAEAWQTALTDKAVDVAHKMGIAVLMVSHGVSLHPFNTKFINIFRALCWLPYRIISLPRRIKKINVITALDLKSKSDRFFDRDIAAASRIPVVPLVNPPINSVKSVIDRNQRKNQVVIVGYFSPVKNQLAILDDIPEANINLNFLFIGERNGVYYQKCIRKARDLGIEHRVKFEDDGCDVGQEIANSILMVSASITEALPIAHIEAMACGTPFVSTNVGAVSSLAAGVIAEDALTRRASINSIFSDTVLWERLSRKGIAQYKARYTTEHVRAQLLHAVGMAVGR